MRRYKTYYSTVYNTDYSTTRVKTTPDEGLEWNKLKGKLNLAGNLTLNLF
jgi:hypothetical protein